MFCKAERGKQGGGGAGDRVPRTSSSARGVPDAAVGSAPGVAGTVAAALVTPADVVKTHVQCHPSARTVDVVAGLARRGGAGAFFSGLSARLIRTPLYAGITLSSFEMLKAMMTQPEFAF